MSTVESLLRQARRAVIAAAVVAAGLVAPAETQAQYYDYGFGLGNQAYRGMAPYGHGFGYGYSPYPLGYGYDAGYGLGYRYDDFGFMGRPRGMFDRDPFTTYFGYPQYRSPGGFGSRTFNGSFGFAD